MPNCKEINMLSVIVSQPAILSINYLIYIYNLIKLIERKIQNALKCLDYALPLDTEFFFLHACE